MSSTTPGPWFIEDHGIMDAARGRTICLFGDSEQDDADLELVASAPALRDRVAELEEVIRWHLANTACAGWPQGEVLAMAVGSDPEAPRRTFAELLRSLGFDPPKVEGFDD